MSIAEVETFMLQHGYIDFSQQEKKEKERVVRMLLKKGQKSPFSTLQVDKYVNIYTLRPCSHFEGISNELLSDRSIKRGKNDPIPLKVQVNQNHLQRAWDVTQRSTASDWNEWMRRLITEMIRESSSPVLRCCSAMAQSCASLGKDLFHAAFVSCWQELTDQNQDSLVKALHVVCVHIIHVEVSLHT